MSRQFTIEEVTAHNKTNPPESWYVVIHGEVYRVESIPFKKCLISAAMIQTISDPDASDLFEQGHTDGKVVSVLKSARRCHVGTIVKAPAGGQQGQPAHHAQPGQPGHEDKEDDDWTGAEKRRREEARKRRLRKAYNPLKQDPDDADEYPADAVAMGYLPDLDGRRWRERRMRLSRFIQYNDSPAVEEEGLDPIARSLLDMDFAKEIWYKRNLKGGEAKGCTGSFQAARPPPPRSQLRPRHRGDAPGGGGGGGHQQQPPPQDPPDSDADDDDNDDDDAPGAPAVRAQVQVEARVREWFPSNSNRTVLHLATPPVTPRNRPAQQTVRPPIQPPAPVPPPQHPQQRSREEEEQISEQRKARELAEAQEVTRSQQTSQAAINKMMDINFPLKNKPAATETGPETPQNTQKSTLSGGKKVRKVRDREREEQSAKRRAEARKKQQEERRKQKEAADAQKAQDEAQRRQQEEQREKEEEDKRQRAQEDAKKKQEEDAKKKQEEERRKQKEDEDKLKRQKEQEEAQKKDAAKRADKEPPNKLEGQALKDARKQNQKIMRGKAEQANREFQEKRDRELQEGKDSQAANKLIHERAKERLEEQHKKFTAQQERIQNFMEKGYNLRQATNAVRGLQGGLVEDPYKKVRKSPWPALPKRSPIEFIDPLKLTNPKRPAKTTQEDQGPRKKLRKDESSKFSDKNRPWKKGEEPWAKPKGVGQNLGSATEGLSDDDDDWGESADELAAPGVTTGTQASTGGGGPAQAPRADVPDVPSDVPGRNTRSRASRTPQNTPTQSSGYGTVPPATGIPTTKTTPPTAGTTTPAPNTTRSSRSGRRRGPGLAPGTQVPDDIKKLMKEHARKK